MCRFLKIIYARRIRLTADPSFAPMCSSGDWSIARVRSSRIALMSAWPKVKPPGCPAPASCANWRENTPQSTIPSCMLLRHIPKALRPGSSLDITNITGHAKRAANQSSAQGRQSSCRSSAQGRQSSGRSSAQGRQSSVGSVLETPFSKAESVAERKADDAAVGGGASHAITNSVWQYL